VGTDQASVVASPVGPAGTPDGRRARRDRNREAVVDALLALYRSGNLDPSSAEIAEHAGLSPRSLFRYFDDIDDLCRAAIARQQERILPATILTAEPTDQFADRVAALVSARLEVYALMGPVGVVARLKSPFLAIVADELALARSFFRAQIEHLFAAELAALTPARAESMLAATDVLLSFESHELLRTDRGLDPPALTTVLADALTALLAPPPEARP
jgi:AcrR family transcriptional regulator